MAMAGLGVPAADGTALGFFSTIVADIGDEQSIEENLSTFASHVRNLRDAVETASPGSLVLLDELGAGTDPAEGAALGQAVLEALSESGAVSVITTHHGTLKGMAMTNPSIVNASMAFDPATHAPLYALVPGVPGRSLGLEVADRLGFPASVLARARALVPSSEHHLSELIADVEKRRTDLERAHADLAQARTALAGLLAKYRGRIGEARALRDRVVERAQAQADRVVSEADDLVRAARRALRLAGAAPRSGLDAAHAGVAAEGDADTLSRPVVGREVEALAERLRSAHGPRETSLATPAGAAAAVSPGVTVWAIDLGAPVEVLKGPDQGGRVLVRRGGFKLEIGADRLRPASAADLALAPPERRAPAAQVEVEPPPGFELDLRGLTGDEAVAEVERYLEQATVHGLRLVRIIHGKGTGVLKARVQDLLRAHPRVSAFRLGETGEGGAGVTMVEIA
jgi:DNA mismatch repair protein MutS2